ncbi:hypothetical protein XELAEV_18037718mg [Xenopus laevis]|uniref:Uncharacterized protein n=1 Tax=Xenopus laevis TaxID=8355 RepID=A0A974CCM1_XENLA|nr:hypothetical protein XELAEV_18037718mg [Xenopus laevis]
MAYYEACLRIALIGIGTAFIRLMSMFSRYEQVNGLWNLCISLKHPCTDFILHLPVYYDVPTSFHQSEPGTC